MQQREIRRGSSYVRRYNDTDDFSPPSFEPLGSFTFEGDGDDGRSIIGVSLGPEQTRLAASDATEEQKVAALNHVRGDAGIPHEHVEDQQRVRNRDQDDYTQVRLRAATFPWQTVTDTGPLPSPWHAGPKTTWSSIDGASGKTDGLDREQTVSNAEEDKFWKKFIPSFPSITKGLSGSKSKQSSPIGTPIPSQTTRFQNYGRRSTVSSPTPWAGQDGSNQSSSHGRRSLERRSVSDRTTNAERPGSCTSRRPPVLRHSTSDNSLYLQRSLSRASSLGDDSRWADVHEQTNSRTKAIKDSIADSNLRLPRLPDLPNFGISEALADFQASRKRSASMLTGRERGNGSPTSGGQASKGAVDKTVWLDRRQSHMSPPPGMTRANAEQHPNFMRALKDVKGDVVILGGYRGSVLRSAEPPYRQLWVPVKVGLGLRKVNLGVGLDTTDEERMEESIIPSGMLKNIGPVEISRRLFKRLASCKNAQNETLRVWDFGYDWRLSPHRLSAQLIQFLEKLACNSSSTPSNERGATVIAHSLGGLITRHAVNQRPELFSGVLYAGVPQTCVNILGPLRNGDEVLLSSKVLTAQVNFSIRTTFALLPLDGKCFFNKATNERFDVDFFDPQQWERYCWSPCIARPLPASDKAPPGTLGSLVGSMSSALVGLPGRSRTSSKTKRERQTTSSSSPITPHSVGESALGVQIGMREEPTALGEDPETTPSTAVTIPKEVAMDYLTRTLAEVKRFKEELAFKPEVEYPPTAVIYGKSIPTVYGACVRDRDAIKRADAYDDLAFASGDGVVLARAAQLPEGYRACKGGVVSSDRGHISLLGDLEAVGRCLNALRAERKRVLSGEGKKPATDVVVEDPAGSPTAGIATS